MLQWLLCQKEKQKFSSRVASELKSFPTHHKGIGTNYLHCNCSKNSGITTECYNRNNVFFGNIISCKCFSCLTILDVALNLWRKDTILADQDGAVLHATCLFYTTFPWCLYRFVVAKLLGSAVVFLVPLPLPVVFSPPLSGSWPGRAHQRDGLHLLRDSPATGPPDCLQLTYICTETRLDGRAAS